MVFPNVAHMQTRPARSDRKEVDLRRPVPARHPKVQKVSLRG
ncbi:MAG: hypothetical protein ACRDYY_11280 [Acidimicrobiales bacterium]